MPVDLFANNASTTVSSGGTTAPAAGTSESWTVASSASFPAASNTATPATVFRINDPAVPGEWMTVTNVSGTTWTVTRGAEGTVAAHTAGFTVNQVVTSGYLAGLELRSGSINVKTAFGAKGDGKQVTDGAMTSASATLTSATAGFTAADVGKQIQVARASSTTFTLATTIASFTNATTVVLAAPSAFTGTAKTISIDGGVRTVADAVITANSTTITSATAAFTSADVGKHITVTTAQSAALNTTITAFTNSTTVTIGLSATRTCTGSTVTYGSDDTAAFQNAMTYSANTAASVTLYVPESMYLTAYSVSGVGGVIIPSNTKIRGDGWGSIIRGIGGYTSVASEMWATNPWNNGTNDPNANTRNIVIEDLQFQSTVVEDGFLQGMEQLSFCATSDAVVRNCKFVGSRSDGMYINMGSAVATTERHNQRIKVLSCTFDGVNRDNRNAISILDCDDLLIDQCTFLNFARQDMPGAIDIEPNTNNIYPILRGLRITNNYFYFCGGNSGHVGMFLNLPTWRFVTPPQGLLISGNVMLGGTGGQLASYINIQQYPADSTAPAHIIFEDNIVDGAFYSMELEGLQNARVRNNVFRNCTYSLILGYQFKCTDTQITDNQFLTCGSILSYAIELIQTDRTTIDNNYFFNCGSFDGTQGFVVRFNNGGALFGPGTVTVTPQGTTGATTRGYRVASERDNGTTTLASTTVTTATSNATLTVSNFVRVAWQEDYGAKQYKVYGRTSGSELLMATVPSGTLLWDDTGTVTPSGALPGSATSANGNSDGVQFTNNIVRQGAANNRITAIANKTALHTTVTNDLKYTNNQVPNNATMVIVPFVNDSTGYTITTSALTVDASLIPKQGTVVLTGSTASAAGALTISNPTVGQIMTVQYVIPTINFTYATASNMKFAGAAAATHTLTASRSDIYTFRYDGTNWNELCRAINVG